MAEKKVQAAEAALQYGGWQIGKREYKAGSHRRPSAACTVLPTGWYWFNTQGTDWSDEVAKSRGIENKNYRFQYLTNAGQGKVGFIPTNESGAGTVGLRRYTKNSSSRFSFQTPGPFEDEPTLKPLIKVGCVVAIETNPYDGLPMISVAVTKGIPKVSRSRKKKNQQTTPVSQAAAGQNEAK